MPGFFFLGFERYLDINGSFAFFWTVSKLSLQHVSNETDMLCAMRMIIVIRRPSEVNGRRVWKGIVGPDLRVYSLNKRICPVQWVHRFRPEQAVTE